MALIFEFELEKPNNRLQCTVKYMKIELKKIYVMGRVNSNYLYYLKINLKVFFTKILIFPKALH